MMKHVKLFLLTLAAVMCLQATAQRKKVTAKPKPAAAITDFGMLQLSSFSIENPLAEDTTNIYFVETLGGPVIALNKETGQTSKLLALDDDHRITAVGSDGEHLYFEGKNQGLCRYDGKSQQTSEVLWPSAKWNEGVIAHLWEYKRISFSPNKRYLVLVGGNTAVFDLKNGKCKPVKNYSGGDPVNAFVKDDGTLVAVYYDKVAIIPGDGNVIVDGAQFIHKVGGKLYEVEGGIQAAAMLGDELYICARNKVLKSGTGNIAWQTVFTLPGDGDRWSSIAFGSEYVFAATTSYERAFCEWPGTDFSQAPKYTKELDTKIPNGWNTEKLGNGEYRLHFDMKGNMIMYHNSKIVVYNPKGIKGYTALKGKIAKFQYE